MAKYTDEQRADAVTLLKSEGYPEKRGALEAVAKVTGITERSLYRWFNEKSNPPPEKLVRQKTGELAGMMRRLLNKTLKRLETRIDKEDSARDLAVVAGILTEKMRLLQNEPTENLQTGNIAEWVRRAKNQRAHVDALEEDQGEVDPVE